MDLPGNQPLAESDCAGSALPETREHGGGELLPLPPLLLRVQVLRALLQPLHSGKSADHFHSDHH